MLLMEEITTHTYNRSQTIICENNNAITTHTNILIRTIDTFTDSFMNWQTKKNNQDQYAVYNLNNYVRIYKIREQQTDKFLNLSHK